VAKVLALVVLGLLVREFFSFWTGHPYDLEVWVRTGYWVVRGVNPYGVLPFAPGVSFEVDVGAGGTATVAYLPFWPVLVGALYDVYRLLGSPDPLLYYSLIKQPIIVCDILLAYLLYRYLEKRGSESASFVLKVWLFSPFSIILSSMWGMFDAIAVFFVLLALNVPAGGYRGALSGVATFAKSIPLIYTIPLARAPRKAASLALAIGIPVLLTLLVIWLAGWPFSVFENTLQSTLGKGARTLSIWDVLFYLNFLGDLSDSSLLILAWVGYLWIVAVAIATVLAYKWFGFDTERGLVQSLILITLTFLVLRAQVNEQYQLYLLALAVLDVAMWSPQRKNLFWVLLTLAILAIITNDIFLIRMLAPVYPQALTIEMNLITAVDFERRTLMFLEAMALCALDAYYFYSLYKERHVRTEDVLLGQ